MINSRAMVHAMRNRANNLAGSHSIGTNRYYMVAVSLVCRAWWTALQRREAMMVPEKHLMDVLAEVMEITLENTGYVDFKRGEKIPRDLESFLRYVARAGVGGN